MLLCLAASLQYNDVKREVVLKDKYAAALCDDSVRNWVKLQKDAPVRADAENASHSKRALCSTNS